MFFLLYPNWNVYKTSFEELDPEDGFTSFEWEYNETPEWKRKIEEKEANEYKELRKESYPDWREFADAWVKNDNIALEKYRQKCLDVKIKYPKPM